MPTMSNIAFLDIEASGLGPTSFPIEVGWAWLDGQSGSMLIKPADEWDLADWDPLAEEVHGIDLQLLESAGRPVWDVAQELNRMFGNQMTTVLTDAPQMDGFWLDRLFEQFSDSRVFMLGDFINSFQLTFPMHDADWLLFDESSTRAHRAEADAKLLRDFWLTAKLTPEHR